jgi:hypothetical protein
MGKHGKVAGEAVIIMRDIVTADCDRSGKLGDMLRMLFPVAGAVLWRTSALHGYSTRTYLSWMCRLVAFPSVQSSVYRHDWIR